MYIYIYVHMSVCTCKGEHALLGFDSEPSDTTPHRAAFPGTREQKQLAEQVSDKVKPKPEANPQLKPHRDSKLPNRG